MRLENHVAIVTGAGQGIGQQIALRLAREGAIVVIADVNEKGSEETADIIAQAKGQKAQVISTSIRNEAQVISLVQGALSLNGRIDILVNNAGIMGPVKNIEDVLLEEWEETLSVNLTGMFLCCKHVIPIMKRQGKGSIVNISSVTGKRGLPLRTPYAASKMGVIGLTRTLALEVGQFKIRVNAICPGGVTGPRLDRVIEGIMKFSNKTREQVIAERTEPTALKSYVDPQHVADTVAFLCSEDAMMITGQDLNVCAGSIMY